MGMAASQARFLGLTARKTNVEYNGQQINQARTALANQSANIYNEMLQLKVPVPPSKTDYFNTSYTFKGDDEATYEVISGLGSQTATIRQYVEETTMSSQKVNAGRDVPITYKNNDPYLDGYKLEKLNGDNSDVSTSTIESILNDGVKLDASAPFYMAKTGEDALAIYDAAGYKAAVEAGYALDTTSKNNMLYSYTKNGVTRFIQSSFIPDNNGAASYSTSIPQEFYDLTTTRTKDIAMTDCSWGKDAGTGRYTKVSGKMDGYDAATFSLTYNSVDDDDAYDQAMINYKYEDAVYQSELEKLNARTKKIQEQDRGLELQLKQCDTEQEALSKELEAVKKVIEDNVERVFKTFA